MTRIRLLSSATGLALLMSMGCEANIGGVGAGGPAGSGGSVSGDSSGTTGTGPIGNGSGNGAPIGSSGAGAGAGGASGGPIASGSCSTGGGLPAAVQAMLNNTCIACHGHPPALGVPASLTNAADLSARAASDPSKTYAEIALARLQDNAKPMPPVPLTRASAAEIAALQSWITAGMPSGVCADGGAGAGGPQGGVDAGVDPGGGAGGSGIGGPIVDPFSAPPTCTSKRTWTGGNGGGQQMNPGVACIACHAAGEGPRFAVAGTLYPTAHEPDLCLGVSTASGAEVVIVGADGQQVNLMPNTSGNFSYRGTIARPYRAKVVYMGRERAMITAQTSGDCNSCHTQNGAMPAGSAMKAPGRILLP